jgi:transcriptional regulator with XRE-family HTH domain
MTTDFGYSIREAREAEGHSLSKAANLVGISKAHLWELESGGSRNPTIQVIAALAAAYGLDLGALAREAAATAPGGEFRAALGKFVKARREFEKAVRS